MIGQLERQSPLADNLFESGTENAMHFPGRRDDAAGQFGQRIAVVNLIWLRCNHFSDNFSSPDMDAGLCRVKVLNH